MDKNKKEMRFELQSQMHEQYAQNYNAHVNSFLTLLTAFFALFGTLGYVYVHTENVWGFSMPSRETFTLHHYAVTSVFVSAVLCFFSHLCAMFGYIERRDQMMNRNIREEYGFPVVYEDPRRRTLFGYLPEFYKAFYGLFLLSQIVLLVVFYARTNEVNSCACQFFSVQNVSLYYVLKVILFSTSIASLLFYFYFKLQKINNMPISKEIIENVSKEECDKLKEKLIVEGRESMKSSDSPSIREEMLSFQLDDSTPIQCMAFLSDLKRRIKAGEI